MPHFDVITEQKLLLKQKLLQSQAVVDLLVNTGNNVLGFEHVKTGSRSPAAQFIKTHFYIPEATAEDKNFITMTGTHIVQVPTHIHTYTLFPLLSF